MNKQRATDGYVPFSVRFRAWWNGIDPKALVSHDKSKLKSNPLAIQINEAEANGRDNRWPNSRIEFCRRLWEIDEQDEVVHPGGAACTFNLFQPMSLTPEIGAAGLGGGIRMTVGILKNTIDGYEPDPELATIANAMSKQHGLDSFASIRPYDPDSLNLRENHYGGILCRVRMYRVRDKKRFIDRICRAIVPNGHLVLTDFVLSKASEARHNDVRNWIIREPYPFQLWMPDEYATAMEQQNMDIRFRLDETDEYRLILLRAWAKLVAGLKKEDLTRDFVNDMMREAEYWLMLIRALESGKLRYYRFHCIRWAVLPFFPPDLRLRYYRFHCIRWADIR